MCSLSTEEGSESIGELGRKVSIIEKQKPLLCGQKEENKGKTNQSEKSGGYERAIREAESAIEVASGMTVGSRQIESEKHKCPLLGSAREE